MPVPEYMEVEVGELGTYIRDLWQRKLSGVTDQWGFGLEEWDMNRGSEGRDWRMS